MNFRKKALFYRRLSVMLAAGLPLASALKNIRDSKGNEGTSAMAGIFYESVSKGTKLSEAMSNFDKSIFTIFETRVVLSGETSGNFSEVLGQLADYFEFLDTTLKRLLSGLVYPIFLLHAAIIIPAVPALFLSGFGAFLLRIIPPFVVIYGCVFAGIAIRRIFGSSSSLALLWDGWVIRIPVFGNLARTVALIRFLRAFVCLYSAGVGAVETVRLASETMGNAVMENEISRAIPFLKEGKTLAEAFAGNPFLPATVYEMLQTGEISGTIDLMLDKATDYLQHDLDMLVEKIVTLVPVIVYLIVATYVAIIVISFWRNYAGGIDSLLGE